MRDRGERKPILLEKMIGFTLVGVAIVAFCDLLSEGRFLPWDGKKIMTCVIPMLLLFVVYLQRAGIRVDPERNE